MDNSEFEALLKATSLPVTYHHYNKPPALPYMIYLTSKDRRYGPDEGPNLISDKDLTVELYTLKKDVSSEEKVETALENFEYEKHEAYIESEGMWQISYDIETYNKIRR